MQMVTETRPLREYAQCWAVALFLLYIMQCCIQKGYEGGRGEVHVDVLDNVGVQMIQSYYNV